MKRLALILLVLLVSSLAGRAGGYFYAAAGGGGVTFLTDEGFEGTGTPSGWSAAGTPDYDFTGTVLAGSQSCEVAVGEYALIVLAGDTPELWFKGKFRHVGTLPAILDAFLGRDAGFSSADIHWFIFADGSASTDFVNGSAAGSFVANTTYYVWWRFTAGSTFEIWWNTSDSRSGGTHLTGAANSVETQYIYLNPSASTAVIWDDVQLAESDFE